MTKLRGEETEWMKQKRRVKRALLRLKAGPCADCGGRFPPEAMDFDHLPGTDKQFNLAAWYAGWSIEELVAELDKCELVCSNCHRVRTFRRKREGDYTA